MENYKDMLKECLNALNQVKNTKYNGKYKDTYELAGKLGDLLKDDSLDPYSSKMFTQLKLKLDENMDNPL